MAVDGSLAPPGHSMTITRTTSGRRWKWSCICGYGWHKEGDRTRATELEACRDAVRHGLYVRKQLRQEAELRKGSTNMSHDGAMLLP